MFYFAYNCIYKQLQFSLITRRSSPGGPPPATHDSGEHAIAPETWPAVSERCLQAIDNLNLIRRCGSYHMLRFRHSDRRLRTGRTIDKSPLSISMWESAEYGSGSPIQRPASGFYVLKRLSKC